MTATGFGTGLLRTSVTGERGAFRWERAPGPLAPAPFTAASALPPRLLRVPGVVVGEPLGAARVYRVRGSESLAGLILREGPAGRLAEAVRGLGVVLASAHAVPGGPTDPPRGLIRLTTWLDGSAATEGGARSYDALAAALGSDRLAVVRGWCADVADDADRGLSLGGAPLGAVVPGPSGVQVLVGEDVCGAPWYLDVGWAAGELVEFGWLAGGGPRWGALLEALFEGYGRDLGDLWRPMTALRVLLHLHDYSSYVAWSPEAAERYTAFVTFLIEG